MSRNLAPASRQAAWGVADERKLSSELVLTILASVLLVHGDAPEGSSTSNYLRGIAGGTEGLLNGRDVGL